MKLPWHFYLAFKQLFPTGRWVSFFSVLAIVGVALGVNVMIVVVAFMKGFQSQFRNDILDTYGEIRVLARVQQDDWRDDMRRMEALPEVKATTPFMQGFVFLDYYGDTRVPMVSGVDLESVENALPLTKYIRKASTAKPFAGYKAPEPSLNDLDDETILISVAMANRLGAHPPLIGFDPHSMSQNSGDGQLEITRVSPHIAGDVWKLTFEDANSFRAIGQLHGPEEHPFRLGEGPFELLDGMVTFDLAAGQMPFREGDAFVFEIIESSMVDVYAPSMLEKAKKEEMAPPRELRVAGYFEAPWRQFGEDSMICTLRLLQELNGEEDLVHGFNVRLQPGIARSDERVKKVASQLEREFADVETGWILTEKGKYRAGMDMELGFGEAIASSWKGQTVKVTEVKGQGTRDQVRFEGILHARYQPVTWFKENKWFFDLLKFEEGLMIFIMIPIGLVAAFAIAIALMTSVIRKTREIGLLVAMGGSPTKVGSVFCMQGVVIGFFGVLAGWSLALLMIHFRRPMMEFIVPLFGDQMDVEQYYHFLTLKVYQPWESIEILNTFLVAGLFGIVVSTLAGLLPAWKAASLKPADALRSE